MGRAAAEAGLPGRFGKALGAGTVIHRGTLVAPALAVAQPDVVEQIAKFGSLRDAGVLTDEEFTTKKAELLKRL